MKRFVVLILSVFYLAASTGITMHLHFCMGKPAGWSLWSQTQNNTCSNCGMNDTGDNGCCRDEQQWVKMDDDQKNNILSFSFLKTASIFPVHQDELTTADHKISHTAQNHAPPRSDKPSIFIRNCNFRI